MTDASIRCGPERRTTEPNTAALDSPVAAVCILTYRTSPPDAEPLADGPIGPKEMRG